MASEIFKASRELRDAYGINCGQKWFVATEEDVLLSAIKGNAILSTCMAR